MNEQIKHRCFNHRWREAAARCPVCHRFYCRECVTDHEDRVICTVCLQDLLQHRDRPTRSDWQHRACLCMHAILGFLMLWLFFYVLGQVLLRIPSPYHEGTLWRSEALLRIQPHRQPVAVLISTPFDRRCA